MSEFQYTSLENPTSDLRLIRIEPGFEDEELKCGLYTFKDYPWYIPPYRALSYVWGDDSRKVPISLNARQFFITTNLESALRNLRCGTPEEARNQHPLWVDAMCINQENPEERDEQVRRMKHIYQRAEEVLIWLGNYREPSDTRMRLSMKRQEIESNELGSEKLVAYAFQLAQALSTLKENSSSLSILFWNSCNGYMIQVWIQLSMLFQRSWFERLWIIQELAVATKAVVLCGRLETSWESFEDAVAWILRPKFGSYIPRDFIRQIFPLMGAHRVNQVSLRSVSSVDPNNILTVLYDTQDAKCSDPRDRLFAILGVVEDTSDVEIDYSIPLHVVYRKWATNRIQRTRTLDVLSACADSSRSGDLPSWVPDFRRPWGKDKPLWLLTAAQDELRRRQMIRLPPVWAVLFDERDFLFSSDGLQLKVSGYRIGNIESLSSIGDAVTNLENPIDLTVRLQEILIDWEKWANVFALAGKRHPLLTQFLYSVMRHDERQGNEDAFEEMYAVWRGQRQVLTSCFVNHVFDQSKQDIELKNLERYLFSRVHGSQMFTTTNITNLSLNIGIVAAGCNVREGDEVWFLTGGLTPVVLRREVAVHRVISPCYLSEHMQGAIWVGDSVLPGGPKETVILI